MALIPCITRDKSSAEFSHDGERVYTTGPYISAWRTDTMERLFRLPQTFRRYALQPMGDKLLGMQIDGSCDVRNGWTGDLISSVKSPAALSPSAVALSACGQFALLADEKRIVVCDLSTGEVAWQRDATVQRIFAIDGGREWAFVHRNGESLDVELWQWPFDSFADRTFRFDAKAYCCALREDRIAVDDYRAVRVFSLKDGTEQFNVQTGISVEFDWRHDGSLAVVRRKSTDDFEWWIDVYDASGNNLARATTSAYLFGIFASRSRDDALVCCQSGVAVIRNLLDHIQQHHQLSNPFKPRPSRDSKYAFHTEFYPEDSTDPKLIEGETAEELVAALDEHHRFAWRPQTSAGRGAVTGSKFGGVPWLAENESWPRCGQCDGLMDLFLQLNSADLPSDVPQLFQGLLQVFLCSDDEGPCENLAPFSDASFVRVCQPTGRPSHEDLADPELFDEMRIVGWHRAVDVPAPTELRTLGVELSDEQEFQLNNADIPLGGDKLLGWPAWQQQVEYHSCPHCSATMRPLFQIDSNQNIPISLGDGGRGWVIQCPEHTEMVGFTWTY